MPGPPPPPPPPPMPGAAGGPPPPPPMPPPGNLPARPAAKEVKGRGALLGDIQKGTRLKKVTQINDRSAPMVDKPKDSGGPPTGGAPPVPGGLRPPAPPGANRARSNSDQPSNAAPGGVMDAAPQLGGLFAGGMPKLKKASGGINMYDSDPESNTTKKSPPRAAAPPVPNGTPPARPGAAPPPLPPSAAPAIPSVAALKNSLRPTSTHSLPDAAIHKPKPPPPIGKKPPIPPPASRKPSGLSSASTTNLNPPSAPPPRPSSSPSPSGLPPPPPLPQSAPRPPPAPISRAAPTPPAPAAPPPPPTPQSRITKVQDDDEYDPYRYDSNSSRGPPVAPPLPPPQTNGHKEPSLAQQAALNAFGMYSPASQPLPPPPGAAPSRPNTSSGPPAPPPPPPMGRNNSQPPAPPPPPTPKASTPGGIPTAGGMSLGQISQSTTDLPTRMPTMDASAYTLTNGRARADSAPKGQAGSGGRYVVQDSRWKFQSDDSLPKPRDFTGGPKRYRAGRGSSVPLDLSLFE